jgi:hypothetical protein
VLSQIQIIKKGLSDTPNFETYNDLIILGEIVPKLPTRTLAELLQQLHVIYDEIHDSRKKAFVSINPLLDILAKVRGEVSDGLLNDFLSSSAYLSTSAPFTPV